MAALEPGHFQPRVDFDPGALAELTLSIRERGILQPLLLRPHPEQPGRFQIIAGERRWRAASAAGLHDVPAVIGDFSDRDALAAALVENLQREDLNAIEEAEGYRRLIEEFGMTQDALAAAVGKSRAHVGNTMRLLRLPRALHDDIRSGRLSAGHARALLTHPDPERAARTVIDRGLNVRQTEALAQRGTEPIAPRPRDPATEALARELTERLGLKVEISFDGARGSVRLHYRDLDQLDGILRLLNPG
ncbi:chromosome partitioning nuclease protein ParB [Acidisphaera rubrifaciens HS-AP3]|uniref:Chromosome partitioning nuclease protein ParB n=1 Tax=Acidisphaera rubrifaciens HS-AP3 TaxID=1231350 RepID=A0A0D6P2K6_9PROT|nr:chromosome partitioning nuclease protein ParB [Acidisphaera rubrifaciens HS-AP3]